MGGQVATIADQFHAVLERTVFKPLQTLGYPKTHRIRAGPTDVRAGPKPNVLTVNTSFFASPVRLRDHRATEPTLEGVAKGQTVLGHVQTVGRRIAVYPHLQAALCSQGHTYRGIPHGLPHVGALPGGPLSTVGTYSSSWSRPSKVLLSTISSETSG